MIMSNTTDKVQAAYTLGYRSALAGEHHVRAPFDTAEESDAYNDGFHEGCSRIDDLNSDPFE